MNPQSKLPAVLLVVIILALVVSGAYWYIKNFKPGGPSTIVNPPAAAPIVKPDLGSTLYEKAQNPIKDQLPETVAPITNPLEGVYKNPFQ